jgi:hypothetical protein
VSIRISPFVPDWIDPAVINAIKCDRLLIEFLRVNTWIRRWMEDTDFSEYTLNADGYSHLPLDRKKELAAMFTKPQMSVCEDVDAHYEYWRDHFNANPEDCCNLRA